MYYEMATEFRSRAVAEESPAFRAELARYAECYEEVARGEEKPTDVGPPPRRPIGKP